jgi:hypothetical protein
MAFAKVDTDINCSLHFSFKGAVTLEDLEGKDGVSNDAVDEKEHGTEEKERSQVFLKLVQTMKASGNLPAKPTPTVSRDFI